MAWTDPRTWTTNELVTAAIMNTHVRDNFLASAPHLLVRKTSDQSVTSSTAFVTDTALTMAVGTNEIWKFQFHLLYDGNTAGDIKLAFSLPASGTVNAILQPSVNESGAYTNNTWPAVTTTDSNPIPTTCGGAGVTLTGMIDGVYIGAGTAGSLALRWAQQVSNGTATRVLTNSTLWAVKLA